MGLNSMRAIMEEAPVQVYWDYVRKRGLYVNMVIETPEDLAQARLLCLTRTMSTADCKSLQSAWQRLSQDQRDTLTECLLLDGIEMKCCIFKFLPLYLAHAKGNVNLGLCCGLQAFGVLLKKLTDHGLMSRVERNVMIVDIEAIANVTKIIKALQHTERMHRLFRDHLGSRACHRDRRDDCAMLEGAHRRPC